MIGELTQERLRNVLYYVPETGNLIWRVALSPTGPEGSIAGKITQASKIKIGIDRHEYYAHTLIWLYVHGEWARLDHKDRNGLNNKLDNLRRATQQQNMANRELDFRNRTGFKGVHASGKRFRAQITYDNQTIYLGTYDSAEEASEVYKAAARFCFGEFANG